MRERSVKQSIPHGSRNKVFGIRDLKTGIRDRSTAMGSGIKVSKIVGSGIKILKNLEVQDQNFENS